jgi:hypothetical protein
MLGLLSPNWHAAYPFKEFWRRSPGWSERLDLDQALIFFRGNLLMKDYLKNTQACRWLVPHR